MIIIFQILFVFFALFAVFGVLQKKKQRLLGAKGAVFWIIFWIVVALVVAWPESSAKIAGIFGIGRGVDLIIYISISILFYIIFKLHIKIESIGRDITKVVRNIALNNKNK